MYVCIPEPLPVISIHILISNSYNLLSTLHYFRAFGCKIKVKCSISAPDDFDCEGSNYTFNGIGNPPKITFKNHPVDTANNIIYSYRLYLFSSHFIYSRSVPSNPPICIHTLKGNFLYSSRILILKTCLGLRLIFRFTL